MRTRTFAVAAAALAMLLFAGLAQAGQVQSTTTRGMNAVMQANGFYLRPAGGAPQSHGDLAPAQLFEIVRPGNQPVTIGRLFTSCVCVALEADRRSFGPGESATLRLRNVRPTPPQGQNYALFVQITSPIRTTLRFDTFVQSSQFVPAAAGQPPTRGNIVADGIFTGQAGDDALEVIIPKAETAVSAAATPDAASRGVQVTVPAPVAAKAEAALAKAKTAEKTKTEALERTAAARRPAADPALRSAIVTGVEALERDLADARRRATVGAAADLHAMGSDELTERAQQEAQAAARLTPTTTLADTPPAVRDEFRALGQSMLAADAPAADAGATPAPAPDDDWAGEASTPAPSGLDQIRAATFRDEAARLGRDLKEKTVRAGEVAADKTGDAARAVARSADAAADKAGNAWDSARDKAGDTWQELRIKSRSIREEMSENARAAGRTIADKTRPARSAVAETARDAADAASDKLDAAIDRVRGALAD